MHLFICLFVHPCPIHDWSTHSCNYPSIQSCIKYLLKVNSVRSCRSVGWPGSVIFNCFATELGCSLPSTHCHNLMFWKIISEKNFLWSNYEFASYFFISHTHLQLPPIAFEYQEVTGQKQRNLMLNYFTWGTLGVRSRDYKMTVLGLNSDPDVYSLDQIIVFKNGIILHKFQLYWQLDDLVTLGSDAYMVALH